MSNEETVLAYGFGLGALAFVLVPWCGSAVTIGLVSFLMGLGLGCTRPISMMLMFAYSPQGRTGEAMGLRLTAENLTRLVAPFLFGVVASAAGLSAVFWISAVMLGAGGMFMRGSVGRSNQTRA
jgi:predicted MFS family arabinose efflux permease